MAMDYSPWSEREIWLFLNVAISSSKTREAMPTKLGAHVHLDKDNTLQ